MQQITNILTRAVATASGTPANPIATAAVSRTGMIITNLDSTNVLYIGVVTRGGDGSYVTSTNFDIAVNPLNSLIVEARPSVDFYMAGNGEYAILEMSGDFR